MKGLDLCSKELVPTFSRGVAGAGVLSLYDKLQQVMFGKVYSGGTSHSLSLQI